MEDIRINASTQESMIKLVRDYANTFKGHINQPFNWARLHGVYDDTFGSGDGQAMDLFINMDTVDFMAVPHIKEINIAPNNSAHSITIIEQSMLTDMFHKAKEQIVLATAIAAPDNLVDFCQTMYSIEGYCFAPLPETSFVGIFCPCCKMSFLVCKKEDNQIMSKQLSKEIRALAEQRIREHKAKIQEMSHERSDIRQTYFSGFDNITDHLIMLLTINSPDTYDHWRTEVYGFLPKGLTTKGSHNFMKEKTIYKLFYGFVEDISDSHIRFIFNKELKRAVKEGKPKPTMKSYSLQQVKQIVDSYAHWLAGMLSKTEDIDEDDVYAELDRFGVPGKGDI